MILEVSDLVFTQLKKETENLGFVPSDVSRGCIITVENRFEALRRVV